MVTKGKRSSDSERDPVLNPKGSDDTASFDPAFREQIRDIARSNLTPSSALELLARLIAEVPAASKKTLEEIKMLDKLLNTARAMMETRLKNEEAAAIAARLNEMEVWIKRLVTQRVADQKRPREIWNDRTDN
jgi:hypothetical protein